MRTVSALQDEARTGQVLRCVRPLEAHRRSHRVLGVHMDAADPRRAAIRCRRREPQRFRTERDAVASGPERRPPTPWTVSAPHTRPPYVDRRAPPKDRWKSLGIRPRRAANSLRRSATPWRRGPGRRPPTPWTVPAAQTRPPYVGRRAPTTNCWKSLGIRLRRAANSLRRRARTRRSAVRAQVCVDRSPSLCSAGRIGIVELIEGDPHGFGRPRAARHSPRSSRPRTSGRPPRP